MKTKPLLALASLVALYAAYPRPSAPQIEVYQGASIIAGAAGKAASLGSLAHAFDHRLSNVQVQGRGSVAKILPDDREGSRHQRFILRLASGQTVLVAHNIDLANRVRSLAVGDDVEFNGEYEWNAKGGVLHWTHHDPAGRHEDGWLRHGGKTYR